jgi:outer membrane protein
MKNGVTGTNNFPDQILKKDIKMNPLKFKMFLVVCLAALSPRLFAQTNTQPLSLKDCISFALKNNPTNVIYDNQIRIAEQQKREGLSAYLPQVNFTGALDDNIKRQVTVIPAGTFSPTDLRVQFGNQYNTTLNLQADQVLYDQAIIAGIKANKPNIELAQLKKQKNNDDVIYNTAYAYYQLLIYKEQLKLLGENEQKLNDLLKVQKLQYEKGVVTRVSMNRVQVNYNNIQSQKAVALTNYELSLARLKNAMGIPVNQPLQVMDSINYQQEIDIPVTPDFNIGNKPDFQILQKNVSLQEIDLERKRAGYLPTLSAYGRYGASAFGNDFAKSYANWYDYSVIGLKLNVPIFSSFRRSSQVQQSQLTLLNTRQNLVVNEENIKLQIQSANTQLLNSYNNLQANRNNLDLAKEVYDDTNLQYQKGATSMSDFLNSDYAYKEAQANYINSLLNYLVARIDIEHSKGTIQQFINQL